MKKINVEAIDTVPGLMTMILGLVHEESKARRVALGLKACSAFRELVLMEQERFNNERIVI